MTRAERRWRTTRVIARRAKQAPAFYVLEDPRNPWVGQRYRFAKYNGACGCTICLAGREKYERERDCWKAGQAT